MFWPPTRNITFFHSKVLLDNSASFTSWRLKDLCQKWKVKLIVRGAWNSLMTPTPPLFILRQIYVTGWWWSLPLSSCVKSATAGYAFLPLVSCCSRVKVKVKVHTLDIAPLRSESPPQKRSGVARVLKGIHSFTCTPTRSSAIGMSHTGLCLSAMTFTDSGGMES